MKKNRDYSPNTSINSRPKSLTLSIEHFSPRATFKTSFPTKKFSEICKNRKESISSFCKIKKRKCSQSQKGTLDVDIRNLKDILNKKIIKAVFQDQKVQTPKTPKLPFKHKFKYQMMRAVQSHRTNPTASLDLTAQSANLVPKRTKCLVINTEPSLSQQEQIALARSPQVSIRTANGSSKIVDSYMYLRKIKTKKQSFTQVKGQSALKESTNRSLYILKENNSKKKSFLNSFYGLKPQQKKSKQRRMVTQKQEYRPWSAGRSEASVE